MARAPPDGEPLPRKRWRQAKGTHNKVIQFSTGLAALVVVAATGAIGGGYMPPIPFHSVQEQTVRTIADWGKSIPLDSQVIQEVMRFKGGDALSPAYAELFAREVRSRVISTADSKVAGLLSGRCEPYLDVTIGEWEHSDPLYDAAGRDLEKEIGNFEGSLIRTEMVACIRGTGEEPGAVLDLYTGPEFRMAAEDRIQDMWDDPKGSCIETKGAYGLVDPTRVCNRITELRAERLAAQHSQVVFNEGQKPFQDVYFKESLKTFVKLPDGVALHYVNYTRTSGLNRMERWVGGGKIRASQEAMVQLLRDRLEGPPRD